MGVRRFIEKEGQMKTRIHHFSTALAICLAVFFMVPSSYAQNRIMRIITAENGSGAFLGIRMDDVTEANMADYKLDSVTGVIVREVVADSPAEKAGVQADDVLIEFDGIKVRSSMQLSRLVRETPAGRKVDLVISRAGKRKNISAQLEDRQPRRAENQMTVPAPFPGFNGDSFRFPEPPEGQMVVPAPRRQILGIRIQPLSEQMADYLGVPRGRGVLVDSVDEGSPSEGKLKAGDVITGAGGRDIDTREDITDLLRRNSDSSITFKVIRDKKEIEVTVNVTPEEGKGYRL